MAKNKKRQQRRSLGRCLPKGGYRLPNGGVMLPESKTCVKSMHGGTDEIVVHGVLRDDPDLQQLARVLLEIACKIRDEEQKSQED